VLINKQTEAFLKFVISGFEGQTLSGEYLTLLRDIKLCLKIKDMNGITSYRTVYLLMKSSSSNLNLASVLGAHQD
jgi:hypothetical protein